MVGCFAFKAYCNLRSAVIRNFYNLNREKFLPENAIIITGSPRSGTTWLSNIFSAPEGYTVILEPLNLINKGLKELGFTEFTDEVEPDYGKLYRRH